MVNTNFEEYETEILQSESQLRFKNVTITVKTSVDEFETQRKLFIHLDYGKVFYVSIVSETKTKGEHVYMCGETKDVFNDLLTKVELLD